MSHETPHELADRTVQMTGKTAGTVFHIVDWWDRVAGKSWMLCDRTPACIVYAARVGVARLPTDNEVVYGHAGSGGLLMHVSELGEVVS